MYELGVPSSAGDLTPVERTAEFPAPLDRTVAIETERIEFPSEIYFTVRGLDGTIHGTAAEDRGSKITAGPTGGILDLTPEVKTYIRFNQPFTVHSTSGSWLVETQTPSTAVIGARAWHRCPESTIRIRENTTDLLDAVSRVGSALLTTAPDRSFPTLRGHPPTIDVGDSVEFPAEAEVPDTDIELVVKPTLADICAVAPLAYYLPASLTPGDQFAVRCAGNEYVPPEADTADAAAAILRQCFTLDCFVRTEGIYPVMIDERQAFEATADIEIDFAGLYEASPAERTARYLSIPRDAVRPHIPPWPTTAVVAPDIQFTEALPGFVAQLAALRIADPPRYTGSAARERMLRSFVGDDGATRATAETWEHTTPFVDVPNTDSQQTVWVGDGIPLNAAAFRLAGRRNRYARATTERDTTRTSVTVVCNDASMAGESAGLPDMLESRPAFDVDYTVEQRTTIAQLRQLIEQGSDYFHFIGHATPEGVKCIDGQLDLADVEQSRVRLFCLNACRSFEQGAALIEQGSVGGLVTVADVADRFAVEIGADIMTLLDAGHSLRSVMSILREQTAVGRQYVTIGDSYASLVETIDSDPCTLQIETTDDGFRVLEIPAACGGGAHTKPGTIQYGGHGWFDCRHLFPKPLGPIVVDGDSLPAFLSDHTMSDRNILPPVRFEESIFVCPARLKARLNSDEAG